jgi:hypothetical protein
MNEQIKLYNLMTFAKKEFKNRVKEYRVIGRSYFQKGGKGRFS